MPDMLVRLYALPDPAQERARLAREGVLCRGAETFERHHALKFVREVFPKWADEVSTAFGQAPPTLFLSIEGGAVTGFAAFNVTRPNYFGPTGVLESQRGRGIGRVLLLQCLQALAAQGYGYAIIGGVGPARFYEKTVGATVIADSDPGVYRDMLRLEAPPE